MINYVVGFLYNDPHIVLIEKHGRLNGVGGRIIGSEHPKGAMRRIFLRDTGLNIPNWELSVIKFHRDWMVRFYSAHRPISGVKNVYLGLIQSLPDNVVPDLRWLIPLCLDSPIQKPTMVTCD